MTGLIYLAANIAKRDPSHDRFGEHFTSDFILHGHVKTGLTKLECRGGKE
jgi:hypothetical protein